MARARGLSTADGLKAPHSVSLKVLRLTQPSLAQQNPLSRTDTTVDAPFPAAASLAFPHDSPVVSKDFILTPLLNLPESFQSAYVGETFSCTLSANNELPPHDETDARLFISGVRIAAEIITPSQPSGRALELQAPPPDVEASEALVGGSILRAGASLQRILALNLQEEGEHTLAVLITYTETAVGQGGRAAGGKVRTFRKLYQFVATNLVSVRTKTGNLAGGRYALEAQLENMGERSIVLEAVTMHCKPPFVAHSLNWDMETAGAPARGRAPVLNARDIVQTAFLVEPEVKAQSDGAPEVTSTTDKRAILGQLSISWRGSMGDSGSISTGWLTGKQR